MKPWIQTYTGKTYVFENPDPGMICIEDIAHALARINRFTGHTRQAYSVAQHCVLCADEAPLEAKFWALMHDAAEAYVGDCTAPLKRLLPGFGELEGWASHAICSAFDFDPTDEVRKIVNEIDLRMLMTEKRDLLGEAPADWGIPYEPYEKRIVPWDADYAEMFFKQRFNRLKP